MQPPVNSASSDALPGRRRPAHRARASLAVPAVLGLFLLLGLLPWAGGCTASEWPDRDPLRVDNVPVDSLEFLPPGARYALEDSLTPVLFRGFRIGYACTDIRILELEAAPPAPGAPAGYVARVGLELPGDADCPVATAPRDVELRRRFAGGADSVLRLLDTLGGVLDSVVRVRGTLDSDSLVLVPPAKSTSRYRFAYRDSIGGAPPVLSADSLGPCESLNHADYLRSGDTVRVRYSWVTRDPAPGNDSCRGPVHADAVEPRPRRP